MCVYIIMCSITCHYRDQSGVATANIYQDPLSLGGLTTSTGGYQKSLVLLRGKPGPSKEAQ